MQTQRSRYSCTLLLLALVLFYVSESWHGTNLILRRNPHTCQVGEEKPETLLCHALGGSSPAADALIKSSVRDSTFGEFLPPPRRYKAARSTLTLLYFSSCCPYCFGDGHQRTVDSSRHRTLSDVILSRGPCTLDGSQPISLVPQVREKGQRKIWAIISTLIPPPRVRLLSTARSSK